MNKTLTQNLFDNRISFFGGGHVKESFRAKTRNMSFNIRKIFDESRNACKIARMLLFSFFSCLFVIIVRNGLKLGINFFCPANTCLGDFGRRNLFIFNSLSNSYSIIISQYIVGEAVNTFFLFQVAVFLSTLKI